MSREVGCSEGRCGRPEGSPVVLLCRWGELAGESVPSLDLPCQRGCPSWCRAGLRTSLEHVRGVPEGDVLEKDFYAELAEGIEQVCGHAGPTVSCL